MFSRDEETAISAAASGEGNRQDEGFVVPIAQPAVFIKMCN